MLRTFEKSNYIYNAQYVYKMIFGSPASSEKEALETLYQVYDSSKYDIIETREQQYQKYLEMVEMEEAMAEDLGYEYSPPPFPELTTNGDIYYDEDIIAARMKLDTILSSANTELIRQELEDQLRFTVRGLSDLSEIIVLSHAYMNTIMPISMEEVRSRMKITQKTRDILDTVRQILNIQKEMLSESDPCDMWRIKVIHNGALYGSILVFYKEGLEGHIPGSSYVHMQDITKFAIPLLVQLNFPEYGKYMPKLNSILMEPISTIARDLGCSLIYVHPLEDQARQLEKFYGFKKTTFKWRLPCHGIAQTPENLPRYYKEVEE